MAAAAWVFGGPRRLLGRAVGCCLLPTRCSTRSAPLHPPTGRWFGVLLPQVRLTILVTLFGVLVITAMSATRRMRCTASVTSSHPACRVALMIKLGDHGLPGSRSFPWPMVPTLAILAPPTRQRAQHHRTWLRCLLRYVTTPVHGPVPSQGARRGPAEVLHVLSGLLLFPAPRLFPVLTAAIRITLWPSDPRPTTVRSLPR